MANVFSVTLKEMMVKQCRCSRNTDNINITEIEIWGAFQWPQDYWFFLSLCKHFGTVMNKQTVYKHSLALVAISPELLEICTKLGK